MVSVALLLVVVATGLWVAHRDDIAPGVRAAGIDIGGRPASTARELLRERSASFDAATLTVAGVERIWTSTNAAVGVHLDVDRVLEEATAVGRSGDVASRARSLISAASGAIDVGWPRSFDGDGAPAFIAGIANEVDRPAVDGDVRIGRDGVAVREPRLGVTVDRARLAAELARQRTLDVWLPLPTATLVPILGDDEIAAARDAAIDAYAPLPVMAGSESFVLPAERLADLVRIERVTAARQRLVATTKADAVAMLADEIAARLDGPARSAVLVTGGERLTVIPGRDGIAIDRTLLRQALAQAVFVATEDGRGLDLSAAIVAPSLSTASAQAIASSSVLLGAFTTYFPVSSARATNIGLAAEKFDGTVVAPGAAFSFWDRIGEVSPRTGYVEAGAIIDGVSDTAIGGGLCQVSTTLFNVVARASLEIDQRYPHAYYIERYPLGLDAAVFSPWVDLKWTNDTASAITIGAAATPTSVTFWLYGTPTGRTAIFLPPVERNVRYPAPDQPADPGHAPGYVVPGRDVQVTRVILQDGREVNRETWYSHYAPVWGGPAR